MTGAPMSDHGLEIRKDRNHGPPTKGAQRAPGGNPQCRRREALCVESQLPRQESFYVQEARWNRALGRHGRVGRYLRSVLLTPSDDSTEDSPLQASLLNAGETSEEEVVVETAVKTPMALAEESSYDPNIVEESVKLWMLGEHAWVQFDYASDVPIFLHWFDAEGRSSLNPIECKDRLGDGFAGVTTAGLTAESICHSREATLPDNGVCLPAGLRGHVLQEGRQLGDRRPDALNESSEENPFLSPQRAKVHPRLKKVRERLRCQLYDTCGKQLRSELGSGIPKESLHGRSYDNPLTSRYAGAEMNYLFSPRKNHHMEKTGSPWRKPSPSWTPIQESQLQAMRGLGPARSASGRIL